MNAIEKRLLEKIIHIAASSTDGIVQIEYQRMANELSAEGIPAVAGQVHESLINMRDRGDITDDCGIFTNTLAQVRVPGVKSAKEAQLLELIRSATTQGQSASCTIDYARTAAILGVMPGEVHSMVIHLKDEGEISVTMIAMDRAIGVSLL